MTTLNPAVLSPARFWSVYAAALMVAGVLFAVMP